MALVRQGCNRDDESKPDLKFIDEHLRTWDRFAQGENGLAPRIGRNKSRFESQLARALAGGDRRAPGRLAFYAVVQVGGFIPCDSELGRACAELFAEETPVHASKEGQRLYFAGDIYFWWESHEKEYEAFSVYDEWRQRDFARQTVIPMYESMTRGR